MRRVQTHIETFRRVAAAFSRLELVRARELVKARRGVAALEFVLASAPFLMMIFGFVSCNMLFIAWSNMQNSSYNAAFAMASGQITSFQSTAVTCSSSLSTSSAEYYACQNLPTWATFTATATENCRAAPPTVSVQVSANASVTAGADIFSFFTGKTLVTNASMLKQGTCP